MRSHREEGWRRIRLHLANLIYVIRKRKDCGREGLSWRTSLFFLALDAKVRESLKVVADADEAGWFKLQVLTC